MGKIEKKNCFTLTSQYERCVETVYRLSVVLLILSESRTLGAGASERMPWMVLTSDHFVSPLSASTLRLWASCFGLTEYFKWLSFLTQNFFHKYCKWDEIYCNYFLNDIMCKKYLSSMFLHSSQV